MKRISVPEALRLHVPPAAYSYCVEMWRLGKFHFRVTKDRQTKLGDYTFDPRTGQHTISVNQGLNPYAFLVTYIHEVAHLVTQLRHGINVKPHGMEWQSAFKEVLFPIATLEVFPEDILRALFEHMKQPAASSCSDIELQKVLHRYDKDADDYIFVEELLVEHTFLIKNEVYQILEKSKTKAICLNVSNRKKYFVSNAMRVKKIK